MADRNGVDMYLTDVHNAVNSKEYLAPLSSRDVNTRKEALDNLCSLVEQHLDGCGTGRYSTADNNNRPGRGKARHQGFCLQSILPGILRLSLLCPFDDVREKMSAIFSKIKVEGRGLHIPRLISNGPSNFISKCEDEDDACEEADDEEKALRDKFHGSHPCQIVPADTTDEQTHDVFTDAFIQNHRLDHVSQVMGYHPDYLRNFHTTQNFILREDGPLPYDYRHYIAIIASARHYCTYLVRLYEQEFLLHNGNPEWLKGIQYAPRKIQDLYEINKILAHRPWLITKEHVAKLLRSSEPWSLSELMHAIILMAHFHSMCSFVYGCGITAEVDIGGFSYRNDDNTPSDSSIEAMDIINSPHSKASNDETGVGLEVLMERMRKFTESSIDHTSPEELLERFQSVKHQSAQITVPTTVKCSKVPEILHYVIDPEFTYVDFASRESVSEVATFRAHDYSWDDQGFSLANRLYTDIGNMLDDKYNLAANLTYYTMGDNHEVDTSSFRRAVWNYIHCMYGIRHDDYDYSAVNQLLERNLKAYIKTLTCYPERLQKKDYDDVMREFKHSEKVHVNLMLMEARQQAELLYALRALNRYIT